MAISDGLPDPPLLVISDRAVAPAGLVAAFGGALKGGARWLMVREKDLATNALILLVDEIVALAKPYGALVSVSSDIDAACKTGAGGLHLPRDGDVAAARAALGPQPVNSVLIGVSCHSLAEAQHAEQAGADYITLSPFYLTQSKPGYGPALEEAGFRKIASEISIPVLALGGIAPGTAARCRMAGASGIAVMGGIMRATDPEQVTAAFIARLNG